MRGEHRGVQTQRISKWNVPVGSQTCTKKTLPEPCPIALNRNIVWPEPTSGQNSNMHCGYRERILCWPANASQKHIPRHPWERSECPLVKMWETFPYVIFGWQEGAAVFPVKIRSLGALASLRRMGTPWSWSPAVWERSPWRGEPAGRAEGGPWSYVLAAMGDWFYFSAPESDGPFLSPPNPLPWLLTPILLCARRS